MTGRPTTNQVDGVARGEDEDVGAGDGRRGCRGAGASDLPPDKAPTRRRQPRYAPWAISN